MNLVTKFGRVKDCSSYMYISQGGFSRELRDDTIYPGAISGFIVGPLATCAWWSKFDMSGVDCRMMAHSHNEYEKMLK